MKAAKKTLGIIDMSTHKDRCKYYNGMAQNKCCDAGVNYEKQFPRDIHAGRQPCLDKKSSVICPEKSYWSAEEIAEREATDAIRKAQYITAVAAISKIPGEGSVIDCPRCGGKLDWSRAASNGHVWGTCRTDGCLRWIQ
jgi:hypothetical protein